MVTFNNTTLQALWLPTIMDSGVTQVLFTYYKLDTKNYSTFVVDSRGLIDNIINMSGEWNLFWPDHSVAISGEFSKNEWDTLILGTTAKGLKRSLITCMRQTIRSLGVASLAGCILDVEACLLTIAIDCEWEEFTSS